MLLVKARDTGLAMALLLAPLGVQGNEATPTTSILTLGLGQDSADTREAYVDLDLGFKNGLHLRGMAGNSRQQSDNDLQQSRARLIGISSDYGAAVVGGLDHEYWGDEGVLETRTTRFKLGSNTEHWYFQLTYEDRTTRLYTNGVLTLPNGKQIPLPDSVDIDSTGTGLSISNYSFYPWAVSVSYIKYTYDSFANNRHVSELVNNKNATWIFSLPTLGMATGLEAWRRSGDLSYNLDWGVIGVSGSQSESVVDKSIASNGALYVIWNLRDDWSLTLTGGQSGTDTSSETITYSRVAVSHRW